MERLNKIFRTTEMADIDKYTIENEPISSVNLMERAALEWVKFFLFFFNDRPRVTIIAGSGNNGGDGFAIARLLRESGRDVEVFQLVTGGRMSPDCEINRNRYVTAGGVLTEVRESGDFVPAAGAVIVDAIFGSGLNRCVTGLAAEVIHRLNLLPVPVVAVDIPSGLMGEDNAANDREAIVKADYTFTFQFPKLAFMLAENYPYVGEWRVVEIGLHRDIIAAKPTAFYYVTEAVAAAFLPQAGKFAHKGTNGSGLLVAGSSGMMGAAVLAAEAAVRSGIGLLYCHVPSSGREVIQIAVPEALVDPDVSKELFSGVSDPGRFDAVAVGPGIGKGPETVDALRTLLTEWKGITILDADALNIMAEHRSLLNLLHERCILTPHPKEFERLAGKCVNDFERLNKLSTFANLYQTYVILKGAHTVIVSPDGEYYFNMSGNPGMAKGGAGDVLTGVLLALAANGMEPLTVAVAGVYAHGLSGDLAVAVVGERGLCAGEIALGMGRSWKKLSSADRGAGKNVY